MALSVHEAVQKLSTEPCSKEILLNAYLDSNPRDAQLRFQESEEWEEIKILLDKIKLKKQH